MVNIVFYPYEDEDLYSWIIRYHKYSSNVKENHSIQDLFNNGYLDIKLHYPSHINDLSKSLMNSEGFTVDEIIDNLTYINIMKPFFSQERYEKARHGLCESDNGVFRNHGFHLNDLFLMDKDSIKICPLCFEEDIKSVKEPYLHRPHNVIGKKTCYKHGCYLDSTKHVFNNTHDLFNIEKDYKPDIIRYPNEHDFKLHDKLNKDIVYLLNGNLQSMTPEVIKERINEKLRMMGIFTVPNNDKHPILKGMLEYYGHNFLEEFESDFNLEDENIWVRSFLHRKNGDTNPLRQVIALGYIFGSLQSFNEFNERFEPFGGAPYPCLNHICNYFHKDMIIDYVETLSDDRKGVIGTFKCSHCGFTYSRRSNSDINDDRYAYTLLKDRGQLWQDKLRMLILENKYSANKLGEMLKADKRDILKHAGSMGMLHYFDTKKDSMYVGKSAIYTVDIEDYRNQVLAFLKDNPEATRNEVMTNLKAVCATLYKRDKEWLDDILPDAFDRRKMKRKVYDEEYWISKEADLLSKLKAVIEDVHKNNKKVRITKNLLVVKTNTRGSLDDKYLEMMPNLKEYIEKHLESVEQYTIRIKEADESFINGHPS